MNPKTFAAVAHCPTGSISSAHSDQVNIGPPNAPLDKIHKHVAAQSAAFSESGSHAQSQKLRRTTKEGAFLNHALKPHRCILYKVPVDPYHYIIGRLCWEHDVLNVEIFMEIQSCEMYLFTQSKSFKPNWDERLLLKNKCWKFQYIRLVLRLNLIIVAACCTNLSTFFHRHICHNCWSLSQTRSYSYVNSKICTYNTYMYISII